MGWYQTNYLHKFTLNLDLLLIISKSSWKTITTSNKQYLFGFFFPINAKKTRTNQSLLQVFLLYLEKTTHKPFFQCVCVCVIDATCFYDYFLFHMTTERHFWYKTIVTVSFAFQRSSRCVLLNESFRRNP